MLSDIEAVERKLKMAGTRGQAIAGLFSGLSTGVGALLQKWSPGRLGTAGVVATGTTAAVGYSALQVDESIRGENSVLGRAKQNEASSTGAAVSQGFWAGIKEGIANFLDTLKMFFPKLDFSGLQSRLRSNISRTEPESFFKAATDAIGESPSNLLVAGAAPALGLAAGTLAYVRGSKPVTFPAPPPGGGTLPNPPPAGGGTPGSVSPSAPAGAATPHTPPTPAAPSAPAAHSKRGLFSSMGSTLAKWGTAAALSFGLVSAANADESPNNAEPTEQTAEATEEILGAKIGANIGDSIILTETSVSLLAGSKMALSGRPGALLATEALELGGKRIPVVGTLVTWGFSLTAAYQMAASGNLGQAAAELGTGLGEGLINGTGLGLLGVSDGFREAARGTIQVTLGDEYAPNKSGLRSVGEMLTGTGDYAKPDDYTRVASAGPVPNNW